jgi:hypothetical protein
MQPSRLSSLKNALNAEELPVSFMSLTGTDGLAIASR